MRANPADVCIIEDDDSQRALLFQRMINAQYSVVEAKTGAQGIDVIQRHQPRVVICDLLLPDCERHRASAGGFAPTPRDGAARTSSW
jgi:DNA-binding NtrC family response regulator